MESSSNEVGNFEKVEIKCEIKEEIIDDGYDPGPVQEHQELTAPVEIKPEIVIKLEKPYIAEEISTEDPDPLNLESSSSEPVTFVTKCKFCFRNFDTPGELITHIQSSHGKKHICKYCSQDFPFLADLTVHIKNTHEVGKKHKCEICEKNFGLLPVNGFNSAYELYMHLQINHGVVVNYNCEFCGKVYEDLQKLKLHLKNCGTESQFKCDNCPKTFDYLSRLTQHTEKHHKSIFGIKEFKCKICDNIFHTKNLLKKHEMKCGKVISLKCDKCPETFTSSQGLAKHAKLVHQPSKIIPPILLPSEELQAQKCRLCPEVLSDAIQLRSHFQMKHINQLPFKCDKCCKTFLRMFNLKSHIKAEHEQFSQSPKCELCPSGAPSNNFTSFYEMYMHQDIVHGGAKEYKCHLCHYTFRELRYLKSHMKSKHEGTHECEHCDLKFASDVALKGHVKRDHMRKAENQCDICEKSFVQLNHLERHLKSMHSDVVKQPKCDACGKTFATFSLLEKHFCDRQNNELKSKIVPEEEKVPKEIKTEEEIKCQSCGFVATSKENLEIHMKSHKFCPICNQSFNGPFAKRSLNYHMTRYHQVQTKNNRHKLRCKTCFRTFREKYYVLQHLAKSEKCGNSKSTIAQPQTQDIKLEPDICHELN